MKRFTALASQAALVVLLLWLGYVVFLVQPSNQRDWEFGVDRLPAFTIDGDTVSVRNVRDDRYTADGVRSADFVERVFDVQRLERVWFIQEPFSIPPFNGFEGIAHTYFVFDFQDQPPVAISVEARRERGEAYDALRGLFKQYELIYIWGTEQDLTGRRAVLEQNELRMYPLHIPIESARALFLQLAQTSHELETQPRFYNTLTSNCTNELAYAANKVQPGVIPFNIALFLPGYSDHLLYDLGFIAHDVGASLDQLRQRYYITDLVIADQDQPDFSTLLRAQLTQRAT